MAEPREISINNLSAIKEIYGIGTTCTKGPFYDFNYPNRSLQMTRDRAYHAKRRRTWDRAFSPRALAGYEPYILEHCQALLELLSTYGNKVVEVTEVIDGFAWDSMGVLVFGRSFNMLHGNTNELVKKIKSQGQTGKALLWASWPMMLMRALPLLGRQNARWILWCKQALEERTRKGSSHGIISYLMEGSFSNPKLKVSKEDQVYDSELAVVAGSDTVAATLNAILFLLAQNPKILQQLREEIDAVVPFGEHLSHAALVGQLYLEGYINEGLRLCPAVMSGLPRETGAEGATIAGVYIPPFTTVSVPIYTAHRDPRNFQNLDEFTAERWFSKPEMIIRKEVFNPFSAGSYSCTGKPFAMMEMRVLIATIVRNFNLKFPAGEEAQSFDTLGGTGPLDCFTTHVPSYHLVFSKRT